ncbi:hypothetical protein ACJMK2_034905 [Sinanodonta woodiana]|uniref:Uncharacterized protein n=1 Tax=Sinanodonta woodiana TaxID=1069815 RepID=A0ABD3WT50_SINWO
MEMLAADIVPETALQALIGLGLKSANNWSLRAAGSRTTLLLVWDAEENKEKGRLEYRRGRRKKQPRRENQPRAVTPSPPHLQLVWTTTQRFQRGTYLYRR